MDKTCPLWKPATEATPRGQRGPSKQGGHYLGLGSQVQCLPFTTSALGWGPENHKPEPQSLCLRKQNSDGELVEKVLATEDNPDVLRPQVLSASTWDENSVQSCMERGLRKVEGHSWASISSIFPVKCRKGAAGP